MADVTNKWGNLSQRTAAWVVTELLTRADPLLVLEKYGQAKPIPSNTSDTIKFRRYNKLDNEPKSLTEGVTPDAVAITHTDISATLAQYGEVVKFSDKVMDMCEDPVLSEATKILSEQAAEMIEKVRWGKLIAGTNVVYANGSARNAVNTAISKAGLRTLSRNLRRQDAKPINEIVSSTPNFNTEPVEGGFVIIGHVDLENDLRELEGFIPVAKYGSMKAMPGEVGSWENFRFILTTLAPILEDAGGDVNGMISSTGTKADVYPLLVLAQDAYGIVPFKGVNAVTPTVTGGAPSPSDPLGQRTNVGWKAYQTCIILNDAWMSRYEVAVKA